MGIYDYEFMKRIEELENELEEIKKSLDQKEKKVNYFEGCAGCDFQNIEDWQLPCIKCSRLYSDFYRRAENES